MTLSYGAAVASWAERHRAAIETALDAGEQLRDADRVIVTGRGKRSRAVPRRGFVLAVTDRRIVAFSASTWLARPGQVIAAWAYADGAALSRAPLGRVRLVLPDRSIVTLASYGLRSVSHLAR